MKWPAYSPDLNAIGNICDYLGRQIRVADSPPTTLYELEEALARVWVVITIKFVSQYIRNMSQRYQYVIQARGGHIRY